ncbi:hypothetical protein Tco_1408511 [Tanacetum coccineum]
MRTRSQSRRRRQQQTLPVVVENFDLEEPIVDQNIVAMADNRTMAQMLQAPIEGYEDAIVVPPINANNFELKQPLINLVQSNKFTDRKVNQEKGGGEKNAQPKVDAASKPPTKKDKNLKTSYKSSGCFICDGPHRARDCPKKASLNGLSAHEDEEASDGRSMGSIRILNAIKAKTEMPKIEQEYLVHSKKIRSTHNFVADDEAKRLGINAMKGSRTIKAVNSLAKDIHGVAKDIRNCMVSTSGKPKSECEDPFGQAFEGKESTRAALANCVRYQASAGCDWVSSKVENSTAIPLIADLFDQTGKERYLQVGLENPGTT